MADQCLLKDCAEVNIITDFGLYIDVGGDAACLVDGGLPLPIGLMGLGLAVSVGVGQRSRRGRIELEQVQLILERLDVDLHAGAERVSRQRMDGIDYGRAVVLA